ncbi:hypothetical protein [Chitinophaga filiformis]|uniref:DUF4252 domain-containing protein n=1 Tax=Chitinophaga filiformis TaxID=104663 RepID=A0ABY4I931_CHIFI|nr:hypothetical protein [Chitinophaga filiformis]UPK72400.1 hypothetical protein MYF79_13995 [Chitinophaga filiformis]
MKHRNFLRFFSAAVLLAAFTKCTPHHEEQRDIPLDKTRAFEHVIPIDEARRLRQGFLAGRKELQSKLPGNYLDSAFNIPEGETFNRHAIAAILNAKGAQGLRIYMGRDEKGQVRMVLLPVDSSGADILTTLVSREKAANIPGVQPAKAGTQEQAMESGQRCPPLCKAVL